MDGEWLEEVVGRASLTAPDGLVIIDGWTRCLSLHRRSPDLERDVLQLFDALVRPLLAAAGGPLLLIDQTGKDGFSAVGTGQKTAAVDVSLRLDSDASFGRGRAGRARLVVVKDRPGLLDGLATDDRDLAVFTVDAAGNGALLAPGTAAPARHTVGDGQVDDVEDRVLQALERAGNGMTGRRIEATVRGARAERVRAAVRELLGRDLITQSPGTNRSFVYRLAGASRSVRPGASQGLPESSDGGASSPALKRPGEGHTPAEGPIQCVPDAVGVES